VYDPDPERARLTAARDQGVPWYRWGPYLAERHWGTVREDYSPYGTAWDYFPHDQARSRAYRWGEDGLLGICDDRGLLCFALALWNGADPILKERLFGLTGNEGNHGEDVKEYWYYLDNTPTHSYMAALYKYPQRAFPYADLVAVNRARGRDAPEYELLDTGVFADNRYFDILVEYAKASPDDISIRISVTNQGPDAAPLHLLPHLWFRNTWSWSHGAPRPSLSVTPTEARAPSQAASEQAGAAATSGTDQTMLSLPPSPMIHAAHPELGEYWLACEGAPALLFTENETDAERLWHSPSATPYVKDGIARAVLHHAAATVNPEQRGTKAAAHYRLAIPAGGNQTVLLRLSDRPVVEPFTEAADLFAVRRQEADRFYAIYGSEALTDDERQVQRQAFAGLLWSKQFYHYDVRQWLAGDPAQPSPPPERRKGRNRRWFMLDAQDVIAMPDKWEYPWFAAWDLGFHCITLALLDPEFAKRQLLLLGRVWYQHPNGQLPAYEWAFGDVNPPVQAWAAWRVYKIEQRITGRADREFLVRMFHKLLLNFTWWVNRQDPDGLNIFEGGFLGLDNIGVFDRSYALPTGGHLEQSDGTAWMAMYCLNMVTIALELSRTDDAYQDIATKFFEHFAYVAGAMNNLGGSGIGLWDENDQFYYDVLRLPEGPPRPLQVRSLVGLIPLLAVETTDRDLMQAVPTFAKHAAWFLDHHPELAGLVAHNVGDGVAGRRLIALVPPDRLRAVLRRMLDTAEFLSDYGIRSLSKYHQAHPYSLEANGTSYSVDYEPAESRTPLFGGNSNWRGPVWFPINYLLIEALQKYHHYYGDSLQVEFPTGSGNLLTLAAVAQELSRRLIALFVRGADGRRPVFGNYTVMQTDPRWSEHLLFYEYFHGDTGAGLGASHQTGWTALVGKLLDQVARWPFTDAGPPA
jgi:hypothetical protein